jgi:hypothetical protein
VDQFIGREDLEELKMNWVKDELASLQEWFFHALPLHYGGSSNDEPQGEKDQ